jgi:LysR family transcriptional activator of nhaA
MALQLNYKHLHYFWIIAREGSIVEASKILHLSPQTLSGQLAELEKSFGGLLFVRRARQLHLTTLGELVFRHASEMFNIGEDLKRQAELMVQRKLLSLSVGIASSIHKMMAYHVIKPAMDQESELNISCSTGETDYLVEELSRYRFDIVLTDQLPSKISELQLHWYKVAESSLSIFSDSRVAERLRKGFPASLDQHPFLATTVDPPYFSQLMQWFDTQHIRPVIRAKIDDSALIKVFGARGLGVFVAPTIIQDEVCRQYQVQSIGQIDEIQEALYAVCRSRYSGNPAVEAICKQQRTSLNID